MLKTSSTESAEPRKGVVGVGGGGKNKAEPVGKHEVEGDDGGGRSGRRDLSSHPLALRTLFIRKKVSIT